MNGNSPATVSADGGTVRNPTCHRILIIGAGISGLAAAHKALEDAQSRDLPIEVTVLEASDRPGGTICTEERDGSLIEHGADSFITTKPWALDLCGKLGLQSELISTNEQHRRALVVHNGRLHPIPEGFWMLAPTKFAPFLRSPLFSPLGKLRVLLELLVPRKSEGGDESLASFVTRRFGHEALERVAQPMIGGIYTADPNELSLQATMPIFLELEQKHGSVIRGLRKRPREDAGRASGARYSAFVSFRRGMQTMIDRLTDAIGKPIVCNAKVVRLACHDSEWQAQLTNGDTHIADSVALAISSNRASKLLGELDPALAGELSRIRYASSAVVTMGFSTSDLPKPVEGFGFVVPAIERRRILACTFSSIKFPNRAPEGKLLLRCFLGGALQPEVYEKDDGELIQICRQELRELIGVTAPPLLTLVRRHPDSMPQYQVGHVELVESIRQRLKNWPGLFLAGNAYDGVGIPDCVRSGEEATRLAMKNVMCET